MSMPMAVSTGLMWKSSSTNGNAAAAERVVQHFLARNAGAGSKGPAPAFCGTAVRGDEVTVKIISSSGSPQTVTFDSGEAIGVAVDSATTLIRVYPTDENQPLPDTGRITLTGTRTPSGFLDVLIAQSPESLPTTPDTNLTAAGNDWAGISVPAEIQDQIRLSARIDGDLTGDVNVGRIVRLTVGDLMNTGVISGDIMVSFEGSGEIDDIGRLEARQINGSITALFNNIQLIRVGLQEAPSGLNSLLGDISAPSGTIGDIPVAGPIGDINMSSLLTVNITAGTGIGSIQALNSNVISEQFFPVNANIASNNFSQTNEEGRLTRLICGEFRGSLSAGELTAAALSINPVAV